MANSQNDGNLSGDGEREGVAFSRADFENFRRDNQQVLRDLQTAITKLTLEITQIRGDDRNRDGHQAHRDRIPIQQIRQRIYEEPFSDEEEYVEGDNHGLRDQGFRGHGGRGGQDFRGYGGRVDQGEEVL